MTYLALIRLGTGTARIRTGMRPSPTFEEARPHLAQVSKGRTFKGTVDGLHLETVRWRPLRLALRFGVYGGGPITDRCGNENIRLLRNMTTYAERTEKRRVPERRLDTRLRNLKIRRISKRSLRAHPCLGKHHGRRSCQHQRSLNSNAR